MTEEQLLQIHRAVWGFLRAKHGLGRLNPERYDELVQYVRNQFPEEVDPDDIEFRCAVLTCALGPTRPAPALQTVDRLVAIARQLALSVDRLPEIAIAYGCGKWRELSIQGSPWKQQWCGAMQQLILVMESPVRESNVWLSQHLVGYPDSTLWRGEDGAELISRDATYLAMTLTKSIRTLHLENEQGLTLMCTEDGTNLQVATGIMDESLPAGSRAVFETIYPVQIEISRLDGSSSAIEAPGGEVLAVRSVDEGTRIFLPKPLSQIVLRVGESARFSSLSALQLRLCSCGNRNCTDRHRLEAWNPLEVSLWSFIASAVKGPSTKLKLGTFLTGMYLPVLSREGTGNGSRVRQAEVEFKLCQSEDCTSHDPQHKYEGERCPSCNTPFAAQTTPRDKFERLIVVGNIPYYERQARYYCRQPHGRFNNNNLYESQNCPMCHAVPRTRRITHVWVRTFASAVSLEQALDSGEQFAAHNEELLDFDETDSI